MGCNLQSLEAESKLDLTVIGVSKKLIQSNKSQGRQFTTRSSHLSDAALHFSRACPKFNLESVEPFSKRSWKQLFYSAIENNIPYFVIAVVTSVNHFKSRKKSTQIPYDAIGHKNYLNNQSVEETHYSKTDAATGNKIIKIDYFAQPCFKLVNNKKIACKFDTRKMIYFWDYKEKREILMGEKMVSLKDLALDGCNHFHGSSEEPKQKSEKIEQLSYTQFIVSNHLNSPSQINEKNKWFFSFSTNFSKINKS